VRFDDLAGYVASALHGKHPRPAPAPEHTAERPAEDRKRGKRLSKRNSAEPELDE
jgi:hypothetical protein